MGERHTGSSIHGTQYNWQDSGAKAPSFTFFLRQRVLKAKDRCKLLCCVSGNPAPTVKWYKDRRELSKYDCRMTLSDGVATMEIIDCRPEDSGKYSCVATNAHGTDETSCVVIVEGKEVTKEQAVMAQNLIKSGEKRVTSPVEAVKEDTSPKSVVILPVVSELLCEPSFARTLPEALTTKEGSSLMLAGSVRGDPDPTVEWYLDGLPLYASEDITMTFRHGVASLVIKEVFPDDSGEYSLKAINSQGEAKSKCNVTVESLIPPKIDKPPRVVEHIMSQTVKDRDPVTLSCTVANAEEFDMVWQHNKKEIDPSKHFQFSAEDNVRKLIIAEIFPRDAGVYTCKAYNKEGESFSSCTLVVSVVGETPVIPQFTTFPASATVQCGKPAVFVTEIKKPPLQLQWLKDIKPIDESSDRYKLMMVGTSAYRLEIVKTSPADSGQYQARAAGSKGDSYAAFYLNVVDDEE